MRMPPDSCQREQCIQLALSSHPEIAEARAEVEKASAAVRGAKREYIPDVQVASDFLPPLSPCKMPRESDAAHESRSSTELVASYVARSSLVGAGNRAHSRARGIAVDSIRKTQ